MTSLLHRIIRVKSKFNAKNGLIAAFSDDLAGLLVVGRTIDELETKLPGAIREILEAEGNIVKAVEMQPDRDVWEGSPQFTAEANFAKAA